MIILKAFIMEEQIDLILTSLSVLKTYTEKINHKHYVEYKNQISIFSYNEKKFKKLQKFYNYTIKITSFYYNPFIKGNNSSLIFYTSDFAYTVKIINKNEFNTLNFILDDYYNYLMSTNYSFLVKIFGCYETKNLKFIVMENKLKGLENIQIFDLKGFDIKRESKNNYIKKEKDWLKLNTKIQTDELILRCIEKDLMFLKKKNIMDYSLIIGMTDNKDFNFGIIDILTTYNISKKIEFMFNMLCLCTSKKSCTNPECYSKRFYKMILEHVFKLQDF